MKAVTIIAQNAGIYVSTAHPINLALLASATNLYQRNDFFQIVDVHPDFMIAIQHKQTARVIIFTKIHL